MEVIGWTGNILLSLCGLPLAIQSIRQGHSKGISWWFLGMWGIGELLTLIYIAPMNSLPLIVNYSLNTIFISIIIYYKHKGESDEKI